MALFIRSLYIWKMTCCVHSTRRTNWIWFVILLIVDSNQSLLLMWLSMKDQQDADTLWIWMISKPFSLWIWVIKWFILRRWRLLNKCLHYDSQEYWFQCMEPIIQYHLSSTRKHSNRTNASIDECSILLILISLCLSQLHSYQRCETYELLMCWSQILEPLSPWHSSKAITF